MAPSTEVRRPNGPKVAAHVRVAAFFLFSVVTAAGPVPASATEAEERTLASELLIVRGDLDRLEMSLPPAHHAGLHQRIRGALGVLPWLLKQAGDYAGAGALEAWQDNPLDLPGDRARLAALLSTLAERHPLALGQADTRLPPAVQREARAIHDAYCAGCHDGLGEGDPELDLPARDLFGMGRTEPPKLFLARLINGVKGDETLGFLNPLTDRQLLALWILYRTQ
ncbi:hypothetical protein [Marimonas arenosa]|uniref:Cytochrome c domain-containing protein n=1 Tax=Marimonas arenosa TaxID=1795305 RepID=A0AAE4B4V1_9RHOB|nr:hypothetical protein [Marimonas arenosa]MDQ2089749.1 hypothetical protein [Marimonas arenosa]